MFLSFQVSCIFCIFWACLRYSLLKYMSLWCVYHVCSFDLLRGRNLVHFKCLFFTKPCIEGEFCLCHSWSCILYFWYFSKFWSWVFLCWWHFYSYSPYVWCVLLSVSGNIIPFVNLWQKGRVKIRDMMDDSFDWFCHRIAEEGVCKFLLAWFDEKNGQWKQWLSRRTHRPSGW